MTSWAERLISRAALKETVHSGETSLHEACYSGCSLQTMKQILSLHPEALSMKDSYGSTPLHWSLASKTQHEKARVLLKLIHEEPSTLSKEVLMQRNVLGYTALDHACCSDAPPDIIEDLLAYCPEAATLQKHGKTPLHMLVEYVRSKETALQTKTLSLLIQACPQASIIRDKLGNTPLHYACYPKINIDAFEILLKTGLKAIHMTNEMGHTPLHCACIHDAPIYVINALLEVNPRSIVAVDGDGNTPLHCAFIHRASASLKSRLVNDNIGEHVLGMKNEKGQTPFEVCDDINEMFCVLRLVPHFVKAQ